MLHTVFLSYPSLDFVEYSIQFHNCLSPKKNVNVSLLLWEKQMCQKEWSLLKISCSNSVRIDRLSEVMHHFSIQIVSRGKFVGYGCWKLSLEFSLHSFARLQGYSLYKSKVRLQNWMSYFFCFFAFIVHMAFPLLFHSFNSHSMKYVGLVSLAGCKLGYSFILGKKSRKCHGMACNFLRQEVHHQLPIITAFML